jgi:hypothetical protein
VYGPTVKDGESQAAGKALAAERSRFRFTGLWPHLRARRTGVRDVQPEPQACRFIVIEDFGASGLEGSRERGARYPGPLNTA